MNMKPLFFLILILILLLFLYLATFDIKTIPRLDNGLSLYRNNLDIVISRYRHSLSWLIMLKPHVTHYKNIRFFVYNKGDDEYDETEIKTIFPNSEVKIIKLNNVGMCDHTYLYHIVNNYDSLNDITYFLPDTSDQNNKINSLIGFVPIAETSDCHFGGVYQRIEEDFYLDYYLPSNERNTLIDSLCTQNPLIKADIRPFGKWFRHNTGENQCPEIISNRGIFSASKEIIRRRPLELYQKLLPQLEVGINTEVAHYMERTWYWMFKGPTEIKNNVVVLAIAKNEEMVIEEWLEHYRWQGINHFYIIDNGSTDNTNNILSSQPDVTVYYGDKRHKQSNYYNKVYQQIKDEVDWILVIDIDEYMYGRKGTIRDYLINTQYDAVEIDWTLFTSNGHEKQPKSVRKSFTQVSNYHESKYKEKSIARSACVKALDVHIHQIKGKSVKNPPELGFNHYRIMSFEYFSKVKMTRGAADIPSSENVRTRDYFDKYNHGNTYDNELKMLLIDYEKNKSPIVEDID